MDQLGRRVLRFDRFALDLTRGYLRAGHQDIDLRPKAFEVLRHLAENAGRLMPKQELYEAVWPNVSVSDDSLVQCIRELRDKLGDDERRLIKTVSRRGYMLDATVTTATIAAAPAQQCVTETGAGETLPAADRVVDDRLPVASRRRTWWAIGSMILLLAVLIAAASPWATVAPRTPAQAESPVATAPDPRPWLVVLPFQNVGGDPEQEYFADGVTEDLTDGLSRLGPIVVARGTAFAYKGKPIDVRQIGRELGVRYVLEGTVRRFGDEVRVTARLADVQATADIWTETFDIDRHDLPQLRDDVTARLAQFFQLGLVYAENARSLRERPHDPEARDFLMRARALFERTARGRDVSEPRRLFREALRRDESLTGAWIGLALTYIRNVRFSPTHEQDLLAANEAAERAMALDPRAAGSQLVMGWVRYEQKQMDQALAAFEQAVQFDPTEPLAHASVAAANVMLGRAENAPEPLRKAMRLSPRDPSLPMWQMFMGAVCLHLRRDAEAVDWLNKSMALNPADPFARMFLASALALSSREAEAKVEMAALRRLQPEFTLSRFKALEPSDVPAFREQRERIYEGLRRAGLPE
jgi:adenylate cyclase